MGILIFHCMSIFTFSHRGVSMHVWCVTLYSIECMFYRVSMAALPGYKRWYVPSHCPHIASFVNLSYLLYKAYYFEISIIHLSFRYYNISDIYIHIYGIYNEY